MILLTLSQIKALDLEAQIMGSAYDKKRDDQYDHDLVVQITCQAKTNFKIKLGVEIQFTSSDSNEPISIISQIIPDLHSKSVTDMSVVFTFHDFSRLVDRIYEDYLDEDSHELVGLGSFSILVILEDAAILDVIPDVVIPYIITASPYVNLN